MGGDTRLDAHAQELLGLSDGSALLSESLLRLCEGNDERDADLLRAADADYRVGDAEYRVGDTEYRVGNGDRHSGDTTYHTADTSYLSGDTSYLPGDAAFHSGETAFCGGEKGQELGYGTADTGGYLTIEAPFHSTDPSTFRNGGDADFCSGDGTFRVGGDSSFRAAESAFRADECSFGAGDTGYLAADTTYMAADTAYRGDDTGFRGGDTGFHSGESTTYSTHHGYPNFNASDLISGMSNDLPISPLADPCTHLPLDMHPPALGQSEHVNGHTHTSGHLHGTTSAHTTHTHSTSTHTHCTSTHTHCSSGNGLSDDGETTSIETVSGKIRLHTPYPYTGGFASSVSVSPTAYADPANVLCDIHTLGGTDVHSLGGAEMHTAEVREPVDMPTLDDRDIHTLQGDIHTIVDQMRRVEEDAIMGDSHAGNSKAISLSRPPEENLFIGDLPVWD